MKKLMKMVLSAWCLVLGAEAAMAAAELPEGYKPVECIVAPNGAYIDTGYKPNQDTRVVMDVTVQGAGEYWFGCWDRNYNDGAFAFGNDGGGIYAGYGNQGGTFGEVVANGRHTVELDGKKVKVDGGDYHSFADASFTLTHNLYLFAQNRAGTAVWHESQASVICYGCTISEGGSVKRSFVPCIRESDGAVGLYDTEGGLFYGNGSAGRFIGALPLGRVLTSGNHELPGSFAFTAPAGESALKVAEGATVTLNIPVGVTVTLKGGDASGMIGAGAGIEVPASAKLVIAGLGTLNATGGKAANGVDGKQGATPASYDSSTETSTAPSGGWGGNGGGGAGAGIGGRGGYGGVGGAGGASFMDKWNAYKQSGNPGGAGSAGGDGWSCGAIEICGTVKVFALGGAAGANGSGGDKRDWCPSVGKSYYWAAYGSGGGGGGGGGSSASDIGGGGAGGGGAGGGGGGGLSYTSKSAYYIISYKKNGLGGEGGHGEGSSVGGKGKDRAGESTTYGGSTYPAETVDEGSGYSGGAGGAAGAAGAKGGDGTLRVDSTASCCCGTGGAYDVGKISDTERIRWESNTLWRVMNGVYTKIDYTTVGGGTGYLDGGKWYVVKGIVNRTDTIEVGDGGAANLVLLDRAALTVDCSSKDDPPGVGLPSGRALNIFGVASGALTANGGFRGAGIGGGYLGAGGTVTINGGVVTATGYAGGAGIGGGFMGAGGTVIINGGTVMAQGGIAAWGCHGGAGIGGGCGDAGGTVTINGGTVTAFGGSGVDGILGGAGIGGGDNGIGGTVTINGGTVTAFGADGGRSIGSGYGKDISQGSLQLGPRVIKIDNNHYRERVNMQSEVVVTIRLPSYLRLTSARDVYGMAFQTLTIDGEVCFHATSVPVATLTFDLAEPGYRFTGSNVITVGPFDESVTLSPEVLPSVRSAALSFVVPDSLLLVSAVADDGTPVGMTTREGVSYLSTFPNAGRVTATFMPIDVGWRFTDGGVITVDPIEEDAELSADAFPRVEEDLFTGPVEYLLADGSATSTAGVRRINQTDSRQKSLSSGWYMVEGEMTTADLNVQGEVNIILANGASLTADGGVRVTEGNTLNIFCQREATGKLIANGSKLCAGIGGYGGAGGTVTINGGEVTATGGEWGAGIGGGHQGAGGTVTINGGTVTAKGGYCGAGIGGCFGDGGTVTINGGVVTATGGYGGAGVGGGVDGSGGEVTINGGTVTATGDAGGAGIGGGNHGAGGTVTINGGTVTATGYAGGAGIGGGYYGAGGTVTINGGVVTATGDAGGAGIGGGEDGADGKVTLDETKVEVVGGAYGNGSSYVKIVEKKPIGPTCTGGEIELVNGVWVVTPNAGVTAVTIANLSEGATVVVPPTVTQVNGVDDGQIRVKSGTYDITGAFTVSGGSIVLDGNGAVMIGGERIPVKPTIGDLDEGEPFTVGKGAVMVAVRAVPGLRYALVRGETVEGCRRDGGSTEEGGGTVIESVVATGTRVALSDANPPEGGAFYVISVSCPAAVGQSDSTIRIVGGRVYSGQYDITDAVTLFEDGTVELKAGGVVGGVKVTPVIGDLPPSSDGEGGAATPPFTVGSDGAELTFETIPGLCYGLLRGETQDSVDEVVDWRRAESGTMTLRDINSPKDGAFYLIVVKIEEF